MDTYAKASFLFSYLARFQHLALHFFNVQNEDAAVLYYEKIELFKEQLKQENVTQPIADRMYRDLSVSLLTEHVRAKRDGTHWQIKAVRFTYTPPEPPAEPSHTQPKKL